VALTGGDSIAANEAEQMVDPWPAQQRRQEYRVQRQKMQVAVERLPHRPGDPADQRHDLRDRGAAGAKARREAPSSGTQSAGAPAATASAAQ